METVAITGANRGIGLATAQLLASQSHRVVMICRDRERGRAALAGLAPLPDGEPGLLAHFDLANAASVCPILTEDLGCVLPGRWVRLLGRAAGASPRGCSLPAERFL